MKKPTLTSSAVAQGQDKYTDDGRSVFLNMP